MQSPSTPSLLYVQNVSESSAPLCVARLPFALEVGIVTELQLKKMGEIPLPKLGIKFYLGLVESSENSKNDYSKIGKLLASKGWESCGKTYSFSQSKGTIIFDETSNRPKNWKSLLLDFREAIGHTTRN